MRGPSADVVVVGTGRPTVGGITTAIESQVRALRAIGVQVVTVNTGRARRARPGRMSAENVRAALADVAKVMAAVSRHRPTMVAVHTVGSPLAPVVRALGLVAAARALGRPATVHLHGYDIEATAASGRRGYRLGLRLLARASATLVVLHDRVRDVVGTVAPAATQVVLANCVDLSVYRPTSSERASPARLVFVGTLGRRKGVPNLLDALGMMDPPVPCDLVGGPAEEGLDAFSEMKVRGIELERQGTVVFHGELGPSETLAVLARAAAFVLPSRAEGMPMALLEAMACGLPVVVTDAGAMAEVVARAECGLVVPVDDPAALAAAIGSLMGDPEARERMGSSARRAVVAGHSCADAASLLRDVYGIGRRT